MGFLTVKHVLQHKNNVKKKQNTNVPWFWFKFVHLGIHYVPVLPQLPPPNPQPHTHTPLIPFLADTVCD